MILSTIQWLSLGVLALAVASGVTLFSTRRRKGERAKSVRPLTGGLLVFSIVMLLVLWLPEIAPEAGQAPQTPFAAQGPADVQPATAAVDETGDGVPVRVWPVALGLVLFLLYLWVLRGLIERASTPGYRVQLWKVGVGLVSMILVVMVIPDAAWRGQVLTFLGLLIGAIITLSSATVVANALAGVMLKVIRNFRFGDRIRVGDYYGGVTERGLFHVEIQTEDMNLVTLPNTYMVTNPVTVVGDTDPEEERAARTKGERVESHTWIQADVSLGYDLDPRAISKLLKEAAVNADLHDPWVRIMELGDFSVSYRVAAMLRDVRGKDAVNRNRIFSAPSRLRAEAMQALHAGGVEIVSPTIMTTRAYPPEHRFKTDPSDRGPALDDSADPNVLAKADEMQRVDETHKEIEAAVEKASEKIKEVKDKDAKKKAEEKVADLSEAKKELGAILADPDSPDEQSDADLTEMAQEAAEKVKELEEELDQGSGDPHGSGADSSD